MEIQVKLYASLRKFGPKGLGIGEAFTVHGQSGWTIADLVNSLSIPLESAKIVMVDGIHQKLDFVLPDSPVLIAIFPPIGGG
ncbi:MAG: MoaD/ThiS family protein [Candidatus Hodarchaeales archaeon]